MQGLRGFDLMKEALGKGLREAAPHIRSEIIQKRDWKLRGWVEPEPGVEATWGRSPAQYEEIAGNHGGHLKME